jgi:lipopolysaccharide export LptBFGC system permease protein LptF
MYHLDDHAWRLAALTSARTVDLVRGPVEDGRAAPAWRAQEGWTRQISVLRRSNAERTSVKYEPFVERDLALEPPAYFKTDEPDADRMTYWQLRSYIDMLRASGFNAVPYMVQLQRKVAFPLVTLVMTLLAVPFAVTTGRRGAMYGVGIGIVLAIFYWLTMSVFAAVGAGGWISPMLAAWAPNILFGAAAAYMLLTVRT